MAKLMVRGYRPTSSREGNGFALISATSDISVVLEWIEKSTDGLLLHTGFEHLQGDVIRKLIPSVRGGVVVCAASRILIGDSLPGKAWLMIAGDEANHIQLRSMGEWFFTAADDGDHDDTFVKVGSVSIEITSGRASPETAGLLLFDRFGAETVLELVRRCPEVSEILAGFGIKNDLDFIRRDSEFPNEFRMEFAEIAFSDVLSSADARFSNSKTLNDFSVSVLILAKAVPTWMLGTQPFISTRLRSAFAQGGISSLGDLAELSAEALANLPLIGRKSMSDLFSYLRADLMPLARSVLFKEGESNLQDVEFESGGSSLSSLGAALEEACVEAEAVNHRQGHVLRERTKGRVLDDIASELGLTRERVRQITVKGLSHFSQNERTARVARIESYFTNLYSKKLNLDDSHDYFFQVINIDSAQSKPVLKIMEMMLRLVDFHLAVVKVSGTERIIPFPNNLRQMTEDGIDRVIDETALTIHSCTAGDALLLTSAGLANAGFPPYLASFFANEIVKFRLYQSPDGTVTGQPISASLRHKRILEFFREQDEAVNWHAVGLPFIQGVFPHPEGSARYADNDIGDIRRSTISSSEDYLFALGYGDYGLWKHIPLSDEQALGAVQYLSRFLKANSGRQYTDKDLLKVLEDVGLVSFASADRRNKHYISAALFRTRPNDVRYLGRFTWCSGAWTDEPDSESRIFINEILNEAIREKGRPMLQSELREAVLSVRGHGTEFFQIIEKDGVVKLATTAQGNLYWDVALDPFSLDSEEAQEIQSEILERMRQTPKISLRSLKASLSRTSDWVAMYNDAEFFALAVRAPGVTIESAASGLMLYYSE